MAELQRHNFSLNKIKLFIIIHFYNSMTKNALQKNGLFQLENGFISLHLNQKFSFDGLVTFQRRFVTYALDLFPLRSHRLSIKK